MHSMPVHQIHIATERLPKLDPEPRDVEEGNRALPFDKKIDIAPVRCLLPPHRSEHPEPPHTVASTEPKNRLAAGSNDLRQAKPVSDRDWTDFRTIEDS